MAAWTTLAALALAVAAASFTIARTKISLPLRAWVGNHSDWFGSLLSCPYCVSHWLAGVAVAIYQPRVTSGPFLADLGVSWLAAVAASAVVIGAIGRAIAPAPTAPPVPQRPLRHLPPERKS